MTERQPCSNQSISAAGWLGTQQQTCSIGQMMGETDGCLIVTETLPGQCQPAFMKFAIYFHTIYFQKTKTPKSLRFKHAK